ncbi:hypothetical protein F5Y13DRAFT_176292 [Hypoxylon sp. FL1857]|nr:hypothetical protein F5Y13DRAFT_176292 [Hypoxylon sp. FL1857]
MWNRLSYASLASYMAMALPPTNAYALPPKMQNRFHYRPVLGTCRFPKPSRSLYSPVSNALQRLLGALCRKTQSTCSS